MTKLLCDQNNKGTHTNQYIFTMTNVLVVEILKIWLLMNFFLQQRETQSCRPFNLVFVTHITTGFHVWNCHMGSQGAKFNEMFHFGPNYEKTSCSQQEVRFQEFFIVKRGGFSNFVTLLAIYDE